MASNYWIKLYHEMLDDPKVGRLTDSQYRLMINLFLLAGDYEQDGYLPDKEDIRWRLRNPENFDTDIEALQACGILGEDNGVLVVSKFSERQSAMDPTERIKRYRERLRKQEYYCNEPVTNRYTDIDIDKDIDKDKDKDVDKDTQPPNFYSTFQSVLGIPLTINKEIDYLKELIDDHGEKKILEIAEWLNGKGEKSMYKALRAIDTAAPDWNSNKTKTAIEVLEEMQNELAGQGAS